MRIILQNNPKLAFNKRHQIPVPTLKINLFLAIITCFLIIAIVQLVQINKLIALAGAESGEITALKAEHNIICEKYSATYNI